MPVCTVYTTIKYFTYGIFYLRDTELLNGAVLDCKIHITIIYAEKCKESNVG